MNRSFLDMLENITRKELTLPEGFKLENKIIPSDTEAKLNTSLFLSDSVVDRHYPGNVYLSTDAALEKTLIQGLFKNGQTPSECALCMVVITPECDLAQNKTIKVDITEGKSCPLHRVLFGLKIALQDETKLRDSDSMFCIGPIWYEGKANKIVLHLATISFQSEVQITGSPLFSIQRDLLFDLQSKAANHVNRLGNYLLKQ
jgi:hypothetical protein